MPDDGGCHAPDGTGAGDEDVLAEHVEGERRVGGVAEWIEAGKDVGRNGRVAVPDVGDRDAEIFREGAGAVDAHSARVRAEMPAACQAVAAAAAHQVALAGDQVSYFEIMDVAADRSYAAHELMADVHGHGDGLPRPFVPVVDVDIRAADGCFVNLDEHVIDAHLRHGHILQPKPWFRLGLHQRLHGVHVSSPFPLPPLLSKRVGGF